MSFVYLGEIVLYVVLNQNCLVKAKVEIVLMVCFVHVFAKEGQFCVKWLASYVARIIA